MDEILDRYGELLAEVDRWFARCLERYPGQIACRYGCSECCRGLFDITLLDALNLKRGSDSLSQEVRLAVRTQAERRLKTLGQEWPGFTAPWTLNHLPEEMWDAMMPEEDETPCALLSEEGVCLVYSHRPMTCRLNGIPLINLDGEEFFDEWCNLNFKDVDPIPLKDLRHSFRDLFERELLLFRELMTQLFGVPANELDTIIPAALFLDREMVGRLRLPG